MALSYKVTGGDGSHYGPVAQDDLEQWIRDGRIVGSTPVWRSDSAAWKPAEDYLELLFALNLAAVAAPRIQEASETVVRLVGFFPRLVAYLVDYFVMTAIMAGLLTLFSGMLELKPTENTLELIRQPDFWWILAINVTMAGLFNGHFGATPGKILIGAKIVMEDGSPIGYGRALLRYLAEWVSAFSLGAGYLFVAFRPDRRALHDLLAGTRVVFTP
jgi:uncharacterized RDD family membrane protein YckC